MGVLHLMFLFFPNCDTISSNYAPTRSAHYIRAHNLFTFYTRAPLESTLELQQHSQNFEGESEIIVALDALRAHFTASTLHNELVSASCTVYVLLPDLDTYLALTFVNIVSRLFYYIT